MEFLVFGEKHLPVVMLIHGAGWSRTFVRHAEQLKDRYCVVVPVLDGYGNDATQRYGSTVQSANELLAYIDEVWGGKLFVLAGVSLGGQIALEMLTQRRKLAKYAIVEGALCIPQPHLLKYTLIHRGLFRFMTGGVMAKLSNRRLPRHFQLDRASMDACIQEMSAFHKDSIDALFVSHNAYVLREELRVCEVPLLCLVAGKDPAPIRRSATLLQEVMHDCRVEILPEYRHGELSVHRPQEWISRALGFWDKANSRAVQR